MTNSPETTGLSSVVHYRFAEVSKHDIFYREAGPANAPAVLLLHGFPTSSHMFRDLVPELAERHRVIAPDLPGFGFTVSPSAFEHTFDHLADVIDAFTDTIGMRRYAVYVFDYGAPVGFRLALKHPERITAMITQNGNAYEEALARSSIRCATIGGNRLPRTATHYASCSSGSRFSGSTRRASPIRA